jgi:hypothetical protein
MKRTITVSCLLAACSGLDQNASEQAVNGGSFDPDFPGYVTTVFAGDDANRCAVDVVGDLMYLNADPSYVISYHSGKSLFSEPGAPVTTYHDGGHLTHRQSIQRLHRSGKNYLLVSSSGDAGFLSNVEIVEMGAHENFTGKLYGLDVTPSGEPMDADRLVRWPQSTFAVEQRHGGGMQQIGKYAVVAFEDPDNYGVGFFESFDLGDPYNPAANLVRFRDSGQRENAGAVAVTRTNDEYYLAMVFGFGASDVEVFKSYYNKDFPTQWWMWQSMGTWTYPFGKIFAGGGYIPKVPYENVQMITQCDGTLFVLGTHQNSSDEDWADLYRVRFDPTSYKPTFTKVAARMLTCSSSHTGWQRYCDFAAGAGPFVDAVGNLIIYGIEPYDDAFPDDGTAVKFREF